MGNCINNSHNVPDLNILEDERNIKNRNNNKKDVLKTIIQVNRQKLEDHFDLQEILSEIQSQEKIIVQKPLKNIENFVGTHKISNLKYQIKKMRKSGMNSTEIEDLKKEQRALHNLDHPNIIHTYDYYEDEDYISVVSEYIQEGGGLSYLLRKIFLINDTVQNNSPKNQSLDFQELNFIEQESKKKKNHILQSIDYGSKKDGYDEENILQKKKFLIKKILFQILRGLSHCHFNKIVHRNINLNNLLLRQLKTKSEKQDQFVLKLIEFGSSSIIHEGFFLHKVMDVEHNYMAPEILNKFYNEKCDIWSAGIIAFKLLVGFEPFNDSFEYNILKNVQNKEINFHQYQIIKDTPFFKSFIENLLERNFSKRYSAIEALNCDYFEEIRKINSQVDKQLFIDSLRKLNQFKENYIFQNSLIMFMCDRIIPYREIENDLKLFDYFDQLCDFKGVLKIQTISKKYKEIIEEQNNNNIDSVFEKLDLRKDGEIHYSEWLMFNLDRQQFINEEYLQKTFNLLDQNKSETLDMDEIIYLFDSINCSETMREIWHTNQSTYFKNHQEHINITYPEFVEIMKENHVSKNKNANIINQNIDSFANNLKNITHHNEFTNQNNLQNIKTITEYKQEKIIQAKRYCC